MGQSAAKPAAEERAKALGAYYTDSQVAEFLIRWAVRHSHDRVLDPSFGGGVFLRAAGKRIRELGGKPGAQLFGVELDAEVHTAIGALLRNEFSTAGESLAAGDFFEVLPGRLPQVEVVAGNPPFIRYQRFGGASRERALKRAAEQGLRLSGLASSWLPFLVHSVRFVAPGGRLAMVVPFEIGHAAYARPVLAHLASSFEQVTFLTFRKKLFPALSEDTILLLAGGRGAGDGQGRFTMRDLEHSGMLADCLGGPAEGRGYKMLDTDGIVSGRERMVEWLMPDKSRELYRELKQSACAMRLGQLADVGIGYVTGANDYFHLSPEAVREWRIPESYLRRAVRRGRAFTGLRFDDPDWQAGAATGDAGYLLELPATGNLPASVKRYLELGKQQGVDRTFKCRTRRPWYRVPHVRLPDAFLTYMSGTSPRLVANGAGAVAPNTLHVLRLHEGSASTSAGLAALWQTSLTRLSVEIEGHALGGGMLKLEPTEAERVVLPRPRSGDTMAALALELDAAARLHGPAEAVRLADEALLRKGAGLSLADVKLLGQAADALRQRRSSRSAR